MPHIDEKFKDNAPEKTVENIIKILDSIGIKLNETWFDSGLDHCYSLRVAATGGFPGTNGKGATPALARASAYGEFIERLQTGLFLYKFQSLEKNPEMYLHTYAPDVKYMTKEELVENGEWMDYVIATYGDRLTREELAEQCEMYAENKNIATLPFYSLFEDKYVYLPAGFVEHIYCANGCCTGNSRDEAWIHAMSEIMERHSNIHMLLSGEAAPVIPDEIIKEFDSVYSVIEKLRSLDYDVSVLDFSLGSGFPVVATRIISKKTGGYMVNVGADPILEIAVKRTLTELFQGKSIDTFTSRQTYNILNSIKDINPKHNVLNQLEISRGEFTKNFFCEELTAKREFVPFEDLSNKTNSEILPIVLAFFKKMGRPVYIRNYSYLGFHSYMFVIPGFSETRGMRINEFLQEYAFSANASKTFKNIENATDDELDELLLYDQIIYGAIAHRRSYIYLAGLPIEAWNENTFLVLIHYAYAAFRLNRQTELCSYLAQAAGSLQEGEKKNYVSCLAKYFKLKNSNTSEDQILCMLKKFYSAAAYDRLVEAKENNSFFDGLLIRCDFVHCEKCAYREKCRVDSIKDIISHAGKAYGNFTDGQNRENFKLDFEV